MSRAMLARRRATIARQALQQAEHNAATTERLNHFGTVVASALETSEGEGCGATFRITLPV
jgi:hypothetical protein